MKKIASFLLLLLLVAGVSSKTYAFSGVWLGAYGSYAINMADMDNGSGSLKDDTSSGFTIGIDFQAFLLGFLCLRLETEMEWQNGIDNNPDIVNWNFNLGARVYLTLLYLGAGASFATLGNHSFEFYSRWYGEMGVSIPLGSRQMFSVGVRYLQPYTDTRMQAAGTNWESNIQVMVEWDAKL